MGPRGPALAAGRERSAHDVSAGRTEEPAAHTVPVRQSILLATSRALMVQTLGASDRRSDRAGRLPDRGSAAGRSAVHEVIDRPFRRDFARGLPYDLEEIDVAQARMLQPDPSTRVERS